ncbi:helix-turn-helix domain-containing protein [bacterium]|nr:helix-turn-helix domain-containing protein [bacterium]
MPKITSNEGKEFAEIGNLVRNLRLRRGLSQSDLAHAAGINNSYLSRIENGERRPSPKILRRFSEILHYPYDDLVVKSGILSEDFVRQTPGRQGLQDGTPASSNGTGQAEDTSSVLRQLISSIQTGSGITSAALAKRGIPVLDSVTAGLLKEANVVEAHSDVPKLVLSEDELGFDQRAFALVVQGDSMVEAGILDGDIVVVSPNTQVNSGDIAVVLVNGSSTTCKKVYVESGRVILQPANSHYRPQVLSYPEEVEILGKVILVRRKLL